MLLTPAESPLSSPPVPKRLISAPDDHSPSRLENSERSAADENASSMGRRRRSRFDIGPEGVRIPPPVVNDETLIDLAADEVNKGARRRDEIRRERRKQRERELRLRENRGYSGDELALKRTKLTRDRDRDVSERVALGQSAAAGSVNEVMFDQRLFNQGERDAGRDFGSADMYNIYDNALFKDRPSSSFQYRPKDSVLGNQMPSQKGLGASEIRRDRPVEFERDVANAAVNDVSVVDKFLSDASRGRLNSNK